jgi:hypothetical protein
MQILCKIPLQILPPHFFWQIFTIVKGAIQACNIFPDCTVVSDGAKVVSLLNQCDVIWGFPYIDTAGIQKL